MLCYVHALLTSNRPLIFLGYVKYVGVKIERLLSRNQVFILWGFFLIDLPIHLLLFSATSEWGNVYLWLWYCKLFKHVCEKCYPFCCNDCPFIYLPLLQYGLHQLTQFPSLENESYSIFKKINLFFVLETVTRVHSSFPYLSHLSSFQSFKTLKRVLCTLDVRRVQSQ